MIGEIRRSLSGVIHIEAFRTSDSKRSNMVSDELFSTMHRIIWSSVSIMMNNKIDAIVRNETRT